VTAFSGSSGGGAFGAGLPSYGSTVSRKKKKKPGGVRGFFGNLVDEVQNTAAGFFPGMWHIGSGVVRDTGRAAGLLRGPYETDDVVRAIKRAYTDEGTFWHELIADRDLRSAGRAFYNHPLGPLLDAAALVTLGAGAGVRGAGVAAKRTAPGSSSRERLAAFSGLDPVTLKPLRRTVRGEVGEFTVPVKRNPVRRPSQSAFEALSAARPNAALVGSNRRVARNMKRKERVAEAREKSKVILPVTNSLRGLSKDAKMLVSLRAAGHELDNAIKFGETRRGQLMLEIDSKQTAGVKRWKLDEDDDAPLLLDEDADKVFRADAGEEMALDDADIEGLLRADRRDNIARNQMNLAAWDKRLSELRRLRDKQLDAAEAARIDRAVEAVRGLSAYTTDKLVTFGKQSGEGALQRMMLESRLMQLAGATDGVYAGAIRSHVSMRPDKQASVHNRAVRFSKPGQLAHMKRNTGYAFWNARDDLDPRMFVHAAVQTMEYQHRLRRFNNVIGMARKVDLAEAERLERSGDWKSIRPGTPLQRDINTVFAVMVDAEDVFDGLPGYEQTLADLRENLVSTAPVSEANLGVRNAQSRSPYLTTTEAALRDAGARQVRGLKRGDLGALPGSVRAYGTYGAGLDMAMGSRRAEHFRQYERGLERRGKQNRWKPDAVSDARDVQALAMARREANEGIIPKNRIKSRAKEIRATIEGPQREARAYSSASRAGRLEDTGRALDTPDSAAATTMLEPSLETLTWNVQSAANDRPMVNMIPKAMYDELVGEFNQAHKFIRMWIDRPTRIWRAMTLNLRPAWIINNYIGQMLLLASAYGVRGLGEYVTQFSLPGRAKRLRVDADGNPVLDDLYRKQYGEFDAFAELAPELSEFGWSREANLATRDLMGNKLTRGMRGLSEFMGSLNQRLTDDHTRRAAFMAEMRPQIRKYQKANPDASFEEAARALWDDADFADEVTRRVLDNMIDFTDLSNFERTVIKRAIPFYSWIRGITKRTGQMVLNEPGKAAVGANIGRYGVQHNEEMYGELPEFLKGIVGNGGSRVLVTQGMNPFMTPADVLGMVGGMFLPGQMTGPQNPIATMNPVFKAPLEAAANLDFFYGRPIVDPRTGDSSFAGRLWQQGINSFPQMRVWRQAQMERAVKRGELEYDPLFEPSLLNAVLSYLGLPIRTMDVNQARERSAGSA
jgi:hypothetical protein